MTIGVDLGGTNIAAGLVDEAGKLIYSVKRPTDTSRGREAIVADMCAMCMELVAEAEKRGLPRPAAVGVGVPCVVDKSMAFIHTAANLGSGWDDVPLKRVMEDVTGLKVWLDNDGNLAGLAEHQAGALQGVENGLLLTLGTGIGGGFILNGKLFRGSHGLAPEVGHMVIGENFYDCNCGKNGCFETFASATAVIRYAEKLVREDQYPTSTLHTASLMGHLNAHTIFEAAKAGDPLGVAAVDRLTTYLALGIVNLINLMDPEVIALGGGVAHAGDFLLDQVKRKVSDGLFLQDFPTARFELAQMGNNAGIIGAAMLGRMMLEQK